jgi:hypothetical protein
VIFNEKFAGLTSTGKQGSRKMVMREQVLDIFDTFSDRVVHHNALHTRLREFGHDAEEK